MKIQASAFCHHFLANSQASPPLCSCVCKCQGSSASKEKSNRHISSPNHITWHGTVGLQQQVSRKPTSQRCSTSACGARRRLALGQGDKHSRQGLNKHTYSAPGVLPQTLPLDAPRQSPAWLTILLQPVVPGRNWWSPLIRISGHFTKA